MYTSESLYHTESSLRVTFHVYAVTIERPLSDPKPALQATDPIGSSWPVTDVTLRSPNVRFWLKADSFDMCETAQNKVHLLTLHMCTVGGAASENFSYFFERENEGSDEGVCDSSTGWDPLPNTPPRLEYGTHL